MNPKTSATSGQIAAQISFGNPGETSFAKHFDRDGNPSETLLKAKPDRLDNWRTLQELAGIL